MLLLSSSIQTKLTDFTSVKTTFSEPLRVTDAGGCWELPWGMLGTTFGDAGYYPGGCVTLILCSPECEEEKNARD